MKRLYFLIVTVIFVCTSCNFSNSKTVEIPVQYNTHIYLKCMIDDTIEGNFMFDTGAYGLYLDSLYNQNSGVKYNPNPEKLFGAEQYENGGNEYHLKVALNTFSYNPQNIYVINTKSSFGRQCDGIIGWDFLQNRIVQIDYQNLSLKIIDPEDFKVDTSYKRIQLIMRRNLFFIKTDVAFTKNLNLKSEYVFDIGCGTGMINTGETVRKNKINLSDKNKVEFGYDWGLLENRHSTQFKMRVNSIRFEGFEFIEPLIDCSMDSSGTLGSGDYAGLLGNGILENFNMIIDFPLKTLYLKPNENYKKRMVFKSLGFGFVDRTDICDGLVVSAVETNRDQDALDIKSGDIITHINDKPEKNNSTEIVKELYSKIGKYNMFTIKRGSETIKFNVQLKEKLK